MKKAITLDYQTRKRISELVAVHKFLLQNRRTRLSSWITLLYGVCVGSGYLLVMGFIKAGWFSFAPFLFAVFAGCWLLARRLEELKKQNAVKIKIR